MKAKNFVLKHKIDFNLYRSAFKRYIILLSSLLRAKFILNNSQLISFNKPYMTP